VSGEGEEEEEEEEEDMMILCFSGEKCLFTNMMVVVGFVVQV